MKILKILVIAFVGLIAALIAIAYTLPAEYSVSREVTIKASPEQVYSNLLDLRKWADWTVWYQNDPEMTTEYTGVTGNVGSAMEWKSQTQGSGKLTLTKISPNQRLEYTLKFPEFNPSLGKVILTPVGEETKVVWSDDGNLGNNPLNRWFGLLLDDMIGGDFQAGLNNLKALSEKQAKEAPAEAASEAVPENEATPSEENTEQ